MSCQLSHAEIVKALGGESISSVNGSYTGVGTDTRSDLSGQLFVALKGDRFDAHDYLQQAVDAKASGLLVSRWDESLQELASKISVIKVDDTLKALQQLGSYWRKKLSAKVIAISGSNGKTTTKEFVSQILKHKFKTSMSPGSFNNHWGVPISLLGANIDDEVVVLEMGMNHKGELTELCQIAKPDVVLVTNVGRAHVGEVGSLRGVFEAKKELYDSSPKALQVFNIDNQFTLEMHELTKEMAKPPQRLTFSSFRDGVDVKLRITRMDLQGIEVQGSISGVEGSVAVPVFGRQSAVNIMAAASLALAVGMAPEEIWKALPDCRTSWGRNQLVKTKAGCQVLFDAYNANPESMAMMVKNLFELYAEGNKVVVLGDMLELGGDSGAMHEELGEMIGNTDVDHIWYMGQYKDSFAAGLERSGFSKSFVSSESYDEKLATNIGSTLTDKDLAVIKGSRGMKLERVVRAWEPVDF